MKSNLRFCTLPILLLSLFFQTAFGNPGDPPGVLFILDGSGSMWQKLGTDHKIAMAKTVMKDLVKKLPDGTRAGLVAYGHNRKSDCNDIETLVELKPLDRAAFTARLDAINPQGMTPIALSISHALALIRPETAPLNVILVSDGLETCDGDACDLVRKAKEAGVKITLHVIGFGIEEQDLSALECIAQAGGGQYFPANNAEELTIALDNAVEEPQTGGGYLSTKVTLDGQPLDASVRVFKKGEKKETAFGRTYTGPLTNPRLLQLPAGQYEVAVMAITMDGGPTQRFSDLTITAEDTLHQSVDFAQGVIEVLVTRNGELSDATVNLFRAGTRENVTGSRSYKSEKHNPVKFKVLPGVYDVEIGSVELANKTKMRWENQNLSGGGNIQLSHNFESGILMVGAKKGDDFVDATVNVFSKKTGENVVGGRTYVSDSSNPKSFTLEPGKYRVDIKPLKPAGLSVRSIEVEVKAKETVERREVW
ncbi:MAG: VWA domain-containing protein [Saprospiraceae bacterium]|nr:VWA domain-containing protein [Saprospiraceae bacterium]MCF8252725.1 VWA domain-containing protein [Saprospiraceae bacterium]MCF8283017.1 VWA domain-containing protein [Bacteroidales bacterium]MCF8314301.1 VWA domain-containing protein [Saprospiraceae bacterium]MCF8443154.1 VWA domain-containing protein [Saprospiraceae bacterium]